MANSFYTPALNKWAEGSIHWSSAGSDTFSVFLVRTTGGSSGTDHYVFNSTHEFVASIPDNATARTSATTGLVLTNTSCPDDDGAMDAADTTFVSVAAGAEIGAVIVIQNTGTEATSPLLAYFDTGSGLPVTPDGNNITVQWSASTPYIMKLGST